tara:strand:+ start:93 stop:719 length:627 start_codon:yes stop_codon:yes gene_type:complete
MNEELIKEIREKVQPYYKNEGGHGFDHIERMFNLAMTLCEDVDKEIVALACLLHDVARLKEDRKECEDHSEEGALMAEKILEGYDLDKIKHIQACIRTHRYSRGLKPESKEAEIVQDADNLEALGAICVARVFLYNGLHKLPLYEPDVEPDEEYHGQNSNAINHFYEKILKLKPESFHTLKAKEIAKERYEFIEKFLEQFKGEWEGKK